MSTPVDPLVLRVAEAAPDIASLSLEHLAQIRQCDAYEFLGRLSAVLAAAREIVRQDDESPDRCNVDMRLLRDALAAADAEVR